MEKINYILHLNHAFGKFCDDDRLSPFHVSLYFSLFQYWNLAKFRNPISISRSETMRAAKIGSVNTYIRCMKELHAWKYLDYQPSYNPLKGSKVHMYNFDNANNKTRNNGSDISADNSTKKTITKAPAKAHETLVIPSKNNSNSKNKTNKLKNSKHEHKRRKISKDSVSANGKTAKAKNKSSARPARRQIEIHFAKKQWPAIEAQKFFNYYQSNGWLVGGKTPMRSWQAAARNWMLNAEKFSPSSKGIKGAANRATKQISNEKNYAEPL